MPLYDYRCINRDCSEFLKEFERHAWIADRDSQCCDECGFKLDKIYKPTPRYVPWQPYFDIGLGVDVTGRDHHRRLMRDMNCVQRDPPSKGDQSAYKDRAMQRRREEGRKT